MSHKQIASGEDTRQRIKRLWLMGLSRVHIADRLGLSKARVSEVLKELDLTGNGARRN